MLSGKRIILGVTGGIAAYKAAFLLRALQKSGAEVRVIMTPDATRFVGIQTFASLSKHDVAVEIFPKNRNRSSAWTRHIEWGEWADLYVIAPCTANTLAKLAHGMADNMLTAAFSAARCPILICPTMDGEMYNSPAVKKNIEQLQLNGCHLLEPETGYLASGLEGRGRLPETETILNECHWILSGSQGVLAGKKVLVTAGPTREYIDPVRFFSNPSSGKMGFAMARAAQKLGAEVTLLHGPVNLETPQGIVTEAFESTADLFSLAKQHADADVIIMAAAVSDFTPKKHYDHKIKKKEAQKNIAFESTPDILAWLSKNRREGQMLIGFAMETENILENATKKRKQKNIDWIAANSLTNQGSGFSANTNTVQLIGRTESIEISGTKDEVAQEILGHIFEAGES